MIRARLLFAFVALAAIGCAPDATRTTAPEIQFGKSAGGKTTVAVKSTDPKVAPQNVTLDLRVLGSGFDAGTRVSFAVGGVPTSKVTANSTVFISATELIANVTVAPDADTLSYDVVATTSKGIKGIGSELFKISALPPSTWLIPIDDADLSFRSDRKYLTDAGNSAYKHLVCGVNAVMFGPGSSSNSGDAVIQTANPRAADRKCPDWPRKVTYLFGDGSSETVSLDANVQHLQNSDYYIPIGATVKRGLNLGGSARCQGLRFKAVGTEGPIVGDSVLVTRVNSFTWDVQSQPYPNNRVNCRTTGETFNMNVRFRVLIEWALPG